MAVTIPDEIVRATRMTEAELKQEIAVLLYERERLTLAQSARLAGITRLQFQHLLASRQLTIHYDQADFTEDLKTLRELGRS